MVRVFWLVSLVSLAMVVMVVIVRVVLVVGLVGLNVNQMLFALGSYKFPLTQNLGKDL